VVSLCVRIRQVRVGNPKNSLLNVGANRGNIAEFLPVIESTASNYVVNCGECPLRMIQMAMQHAIGL